MTKNLKPVSHVKASTGPQASTKHIGPLSSVTTRKVSVKGLNTGVPVVKQGK